MPGLYKTATEIEADPNTAKREGECDLEWALRMQAEEMKRIGCVWNERTQQWVNVIRLGDVDDNSGWSNYSERRRRI